MEMGPDSPACVYHSNGAVDAALIGLGFRLLHERCKVFVEFDMNMSFRIYEKQ